MKTIQEIMAEQFSHFSPEQLRALSSPLGRLSEKDVANLVAIFGTYEDQEKKKAMLNKAMDSILRSLKKGG